MSKNTSMSREELSEEKKTKALQGKIESAKIDASQGATMFQVLGFIAMFVGMPVAYLGNSIFYVLGGFIFGFLFLGISYILRAQDVIMAKLYDETKVEVEDVAE